MQLSNKSKTPDTPKRLGASCNESRLLCLLRFRPTKANNSVNTAKTSMTDAH